MVYRYFDQKVKRVEKLSRKFQSELLGDLIEAFTLLRSPEDTAKFMTDLITAAEAKMLSKRLRIAKLLLDGKTYQSIEQDLRVSHGTVAKVASWLLASGEGFKKVISLLPKKDQPHSVEYDDFSKFKRGHPLYFWPELILERWGRAAGETERKRLESIIEKLSRKAEHDREFKETVKENYRKKPPSAVGNFS